MSPREPTKPTKRPQPIPDLKPWLDFLFTQAHVLREYPHLLYQQAANYPGATTLVRAAELRQTLPSRPRRWLRWLNKPGSIDRCIMTLAGHAAAVAACAFSCDGLRIVSGASDGTLKTWDAASGKEGLTLKGHEACIRACCFSPNGLHIASASEDGSVRIWSAETGAELARLAGHSASVEACAYSPDGSHLVSASRDRTLVVWDAKTFQKCRTLAGHRCGVFECEYSPDGRRLISLASEFSFSPEDRVLKVWDAGSGRELAQAPLPTGLDISCSYAPDGKTIAISSDRRLEVRDAATLRPEYAFEDDEGIKYGTYSPDGRLIVWNSSRDRITVYDAGARRILLRLGHPGSGVGRCAFAPDGARLASPSGDRTIKIWDLTNITENKRVGERRRSSSPVYAVGLSPDGNSAVAGDEEGVLRIWRGPRGSTPIRRRMHEDFIKACLFSPDGGQITSASADGTLRVWDAGSGRVLHVLRGHTETVNVCAYSPDGHLILSGSEDGTFRLWDAGRGTESAVLSGHSGLPSACAFSPDGSRLVTCSDPVPKDSGRLALLKLWDATTGKELFALPGHTQSVFACAFSPDGRRIVSGSMDGTLRIWHAGKGALLASLPGGCVTVCSFSPDGRRVFSGGSKTLNVWHASRLYAMPSLCGNSWRSENSCLAPGGGWAICPSEGISRASETAVRAWDLGTGEQVGEFLTGWKVYATAISASGRALAAGDEAGNVYLLRAEGLAVHLQWTTAVRLYQHHLRCWDPEVTAFCPWCGSRFAAPARILEAIRSIEKAAHLREDQSPCAALDVETWQDPRLKSGCPGCREPLRFNPFLVDNQCRDRT